MNHDQSKQEQSSGRTGHSVFVPVLFVALTLLFMAGFQSYHLVQQKGNLANLKSGQDRPLEESRKVRTQFNSIARGTAQLASQGNRNAAALLEQLKSLSGTADIPSATVQ